MHIKLDVDTMRLKSTSRCGIRTSILHPRIEVAATPGGTSHIVVCYVHESVVKCRLSISISISLLGRKLNDEGDIWPCLPLFSLKILLDPYVRSTHYEISSLDA